MFAWLPVTTMDSDNDTLTQELFPGLTAYCCPHEMHTEMLEAKVRGLQRWKTLKKKIIREQQETIAVQQRRLLALQKMLRDAEDAVLLCNNPNSSARSRVAFWEAKKK